ncbi:MAG: HAD hydrolase family protein [Candidatus Dormibacteria bacterium]
MNPPAIDSPGAPRPAARPRLVALDLDGTCLDEHQVLDPRTERAVRRLAGDGVHVVLATGRMYRSALPWASRLGIRDPLICYQGAVTRALPGAAAPLLDGVPLGELLGEEPLSGEVAGRVVSAARTEGWHRQAYRDEQLLCEEDRAEAHLYARIAQVPITFVPDLLAAVELGSTKIVCVIDDPGETARAESALRALVGEGARVTRSLPPFVEVTSTRASKGQALSALCRHLEIDLTATLAVGDAANDTDMLSAAGFAVAVAGAQPDVLAAADALCAPPRGGGVAAVIAAVFPTP